MKNLIPQIIKFAESIQEYLNIFQAFLKGYETFMNELKQNTSNDESK